MSSSINLSFVTKLASLQFPLRDLEKERRKERVFEIFQREKKKKIKEGGEAARKRTCTRIDRGASGRAPLENLRWKRRFKGGTSGGWKSSLKPAPCAPPLGPRPHRFVAATVDLSTLPSSYGVKGVQPSCKKYPKHSTLPSTSRRDPSSEGSKFVFQQPACACACVCVCPERKDKKARKRKKEKKKMIKHTLPCRPSVLKRVTLFLLSSLSPPPVSRLFTLSSLHSHD